LTCRAGALRHGYHEDNTRHHTESARSFFDACETGKGWEACSQFCHPEATFSAQAPALAGVDTLAAYTDWMKGLFAPVPDGRYELRSFAHDQARGKVMAFAVFAGTNTGEGGPVGLERRPHPRAAGLGVGPGNLTRGG
jgi:predicted ester cyclase